MAQNKPNVGSGSFGSRSTKEGQSISTMKDDDDMTCSDRCRSRQHGRKIWEIAHGAVGELEVICLWMKTCQNYSQVKDDFGRTALHAAASTGNLKALEWLLKTQQCNVNGRDLISGYTPLHRSIYFGHVHIARSLIKHGADLNVRDSEGLTPFEMCQMDRPIQFKQNPGDMTELTVWGSNANYNLGLGHQQPRLFPDVAPEFKRPDMSLQKVTMHTYHTLFLTQMGKVLACGYGMGGRLGTGDEETVLTPSRVNLRGNGPCKDIAVGQDHSVFLTDNKVWTVGSNEYGQLGHVSPRTKLYSPRTIDSLTKYNITGILAGNFHSTFFNSEVVFMCGLNQGQFGRGYEETEEIVSPAKLNISPEGLGVFTCVGGNDYATAICIQKRYIFLLRRHQYARIDSKSTTSKEITKLEVSGEKNQITLFLLTGSGRVLIWRENFNKATNDWKGTFTRVVFSNSRLLDVKDFSVSLSSLAVITNNGEAYKAGWNCNNPPSIVGKMDEKFSQVAGTDFQVAVRARKGKRDDDATTMQLELMKIKKVPNVHTALSVSSDVKGNNFSILQRNMMMDITDIPEVIPDNMLEDLSQLFIEVHEDDQIHDVVFQIGSFNEYPAHMYILASASPVMSRIFKTVRMSSTDNDVVRIPVTNKLFSIDPSKCSSLEDPNIFEAVLSMIYSRKCSLMTVEWMQDLYSNGIDEQQKKKGKFYEDRMKELSKFRYLLRALNLDSEETAIQRFYVDIEKQWDAVVVKERGPATLNMASYWKDLPKKSFERPLMKEDDVDDEFADVILETNDKKNVLVHKCILVARLEYFKSLFSSNWAFSSVSQKGNQKKKETVILAFSSKTVQILLESIYTNDVSLLKSSDVETMFETLACADFVMNDRLLQLSESEMTKHISLKNVSDVLTFAWKYNARQLKNTCFDFISLNLTSMLENRFLDNLSIEILLELSSYYRQSQREKLLINREAHRSTNVPELEDYELALKQMPEELLDQAKEIENVDGSLLVKKAQTKSTRNRVRLRSRTLSESEVVSEVEQTATVSSNVSETPPPTPPSPSMISERKLIVPLPKNKLNSTPERSTAVSKKPDDEFPTLGASASVSPVAATGISKPFRKLNAFSPKAQTSPLSTKTNLGTGWSRPSPSPTSPASVVEGNLSPNQIKNEIDRGQSKPITPCSATSAGKKKTKWRAITSTADIPKSPSSHEQQNSPQMTSDGRDRNNPWRKTPSKSDQVVFKTIVEDEVEKKRNFEKATTKALPLMQIEDEVINYLTKRYESEDTLDYIELLSVERVVTQNFSTPVWVQQHPGAITGMSSSSYPHFKG